jgi:Methyltransferase FkbM domain
MDNNPVGGRGRRAFKAVLIGLALATIITTTAAISRSPNPEFEWFSQQYGPSRVSEHAEEWLVRDFFHDARDGVFLDVGSYDYKTFSNTYYLEHALGWSGIAIDAQEEFAADYLKYRPRTRFVSLFVSDHSDGIESLFVPRWNRLVASSDKGFSDRYDSSGSARKVNTTTLNNVLESGHVPAIDFLTMDIELAEPKALAGFDIEKYRPRLLCVEAHPEIRQQLLDYFAAHGYRLVARYLRADPANLWFAPADASLPGAITIADHH